MRVGRLRAVKHLFEAIFTAVKTGIFAGALLDAFDERDGLGNAHGAAGIMAVLFEIEDEQHTTGMNVRTLVGRCDGAKEMLGLADGIGRVGEVIGAPEKAGASRGSLPSGVISIANTRWVSRLMNYADDALPLHQLEVDLH